jgi:amino acid transporter
MNPAERRLTNEAVTSASSSTNRLRSNTLTSWHVLVFCMAAAGPAASVALNYSFIGSFAGAAIPLAFIGTLVVIMLLANTIVEFSKRVVHAGSLYGWNSHAFGPGFGFVFGWVFVATYVIFAAAGFAVFGGWVSQWLATLMGWYIPWWLVTLVALIFIAYLAYAGIQPSIRTTLLLLSAELVILLVLTVFMIVKAGPAGQSVRPFLPESAPTGWAGVGLGMVYAILSVVGFETGATLSEETKQSKRSTGRGIFLAAIVLPVVYLIIAYGMVIGYGIHNMARFASDPAPLQTLGNLYWGKAGESIVVIAALSSILGFSQAAFNASTRVLYALGRASLLPHALSRTHVGRGTPTVAIMTMVVLSVVLGIPLGIVAGPFNVWGYFGFLISLGMLIVYLSTNIALIYYMLRYRRDEFHWLRHGALPVLAVIALLYPLYNVVIPLPPMPNAIFPFVVAGWIVIGIAIAVALSRARPELIQQASVVAEETL